MHRRSAVRLPTRRRFLRVSTICSWRPSRGLSIDAANTKGGRASPSISYRPRGWGALGRLQKLVPDAGGSIRHCAQDRGSEWMGGRAIRPSRDGPDGRGRDRRNCENRVRSRVRIEARAGAEMAARRRGVARRDHLTGDLAGRRNRLSQDSRSSVMGGHVRLDERPGLEVDDHASGRGR
jgi:hypothetical protein